MDKTLKYHLMGTVLAPRAMHFFPLGEGQREDDVMVNVTVSLAAIRFYSNTLQNYT